MKHSIQINAPLLDRGVWWLQARWPWLRRRLAEPSAPLFTRIRLRLVAWYMGILVAILLIAGISLYLGMQATVLAPVNNALGAFASDFGKAWLTSGTPPCATTSTSQPGVLVRVTNGAGVLPSYISCYDKNGNFLGANPVPNNTTTQYAIDQFDDANLAQKALANGSATDTIDGGTGVGAIQRYALTIRNAGGPVLGVVQIGTSVQAYENSLNTLTTLLLLVGTLTLACAGLGGWFLSARALEPARLAAGRQRAFIADAAHELRTPLTLLRADAEALLFHRDQLPPDDAELLDDIVAESGHMTQLAGNMLTLARLDSGMAHLETEIVDVSALLARAARRVHALANQKQIAVEAVTKESIYVAGDRLLLEQAIMILLDNAVKYNRSGGSVALYARRRDQWVRIDVCDNGVGIAAPHLSHLGERFYRVDAAHARETGGAGLGVSIARSIAAAHQGALTYASIPKQGTTATLILPGAMGREMASDHTGDDLATGEKV
jgi:signal transduction histidine kinase